MSAKEVSSGDDFDECSQESYEAVKRRKLADETLRKVIATQTKRTNEVEVSSPPSSSEDENGTSNCPLTHSSSFSSISDYDYGRYETLSDLEPDTDEEEKVKEEDKEIALPEPELVDLTKSSSESESETEQNCMEHRPCE